MKYTALAICCIGVSLSGCAVLEAEVNDPERVEQVKNIDKHSSYPAIRRFNFEQVNLLELVDPENQAKVRFADRWLASENVDINKSHVGWPTMSSSGGLVASENVESNKRHMGAQYDLALAQFRQRSDISAEEKRLRRNSIQERILSVSISRCNVFKTYLRRDQANKNFLLGSATTVAGVLGAVLPGGDTARHLAGAAGIFSGLRSEYNEAYFSGLAAHVIAKGIETRQEIVYRRIQTEGQNKSIEAYPLEAAIKDAIYFDGLCSVVEGLDQASASISATTEPGMEAATRTILRAGLLREAANLPRDKLLQPETLDSFGQAGARLGLSLVGTAREAASTTPDLFVAAGTMQERIDEAIAAAAKAIEAATLTRAKALLKEIKPAERQNTLEAAMPKEGVIAKQIQEQLTSQLVDGLGLRNCYVKLAATAVTQGNDAAKQWADAKSEADRSGAKLALGEAARAIASAADKLQTKEQLVKLAIEQYKQARIQKVTGATLGAEAVTWDELRALAVVVPDDPVAAKQPQCKLEDKPGT